MAAAAHASVDTLTPTPSLERRISHWIAHIPDDVSFYCQLADLLLEFLHHEIKLNYFRDPAAEILTPQELAQSFFPPRCVIAANYNHLLFRWNQIMPKFVQDYLIKNRLMVPPVITLRVSWCTDITFGAYTLLRILPMARTNVANILGPKVAIEYRLFRLMEILLDRHSDSSLDGPPKAPEIALHNLLRQYGRPSYKRVASIFRASTQYFIQKIKKASRNKLRVCGLHAFDLRYGFEKNEVPGRWQVQFVSVLDITSTIKLLNEVVLPEFAAKNWKHARTEDIILAGHTYGVKIVITGQDENKKDVSRFSIYVLASYMPVPFMKDSHDMNMAHNYIQFFLLLYSIINKRIYFGDQTDYRAIIWRCLYFLLNDRRGPHKIVGPIKSFAEFIMRAPIIRYQPAPELCYLLPPAMEALSTDIEVRGAGLERALNESAIRPALSGLPTAANDLLGLSETLNRATCLSVAVEPPPSPSHAPWVSANRTPRLDFLAEACQHQSTPRGRVCDGVFEEVTHIIPTAFDEEDYDVTDYFSDPFINALSEDPSIQMMADLPPAERAKHEIELFADSMTRAIQFRHKGALEDMLLTRARIVDLTSTIFDAQAPTEIEEDYDYDKDIIEN